MWSAGELSLISTGKNVENSELVDASSDGRNVFFTTRERLVGADINNQVDVYDARVGGGFPEQEIPRECVGAECRPSSNAPPELSNPSRGGEAGDSWRGEKRAVFTVKSVTARQRRALAAGRQAVLSVRVNKPGRLVAHGRVRVEGESRTVISVSKRARHAGTVKLALRLSRAGRAWLAGSGRLRVSLSVRFAGAVGAQVVSVGLVRPSGEGRGR